MVTHAVNGCVKPYTLDLSTGGYQGTRLNLEVKAQRSIFKDYLKERKDVKAVTGYVITHSNHPYVECGNHTWTQQNTTF